jgi:hypothetical protein
MTNQILPNPGAELSRELLALAPVGGKRRPVKVVEHPAFRAARARREGAVAVLPITIVSLNRLAAAAGCLRRGAGSTIATTSLEAA